MPRINLTIMFFEEDHFLPPAIDSLVLTGIPSSKMSFKAESQTHRHEDFRAFTWTNDIAALD